MFSRVRIKEYSICGLTNGAGSLPAAPHTLITSQTPPPRLNEKSFSALLSQRGFVIVVPYSDRCWLRNCIPVYHTMPGPGVLDVKNMNVITMTMGANSTVLPPLPFILLPSFDALYQDAGTA